MRPTFRSSVRRSRRGLGSLLLLATAELAGGCLVPAASGAAPPSMASPGGDAGLPGCAVADVPDEPAAAPLVDGRIDGCFEPGGEADVYRYVVGAGGSRVVGFTIVGFAGAITRLQVMDPHTADLSGARGLVSGQRRDRFELIAEPGATLYLRVDDATIGESTAAKGYTIEIDERTIDPHEPDDELAGAAPLPLGHPQAGLLLGRLATGGELAVDVDTFRVEVPQAGTLRVRIDEPDDDLRAVVEISGPGVDHRARPADRGEATEVVVPVTPGHYHVRIAQGYERTARVVVNRGEPPEAMGRRYRITATLEDK